MPPTHIGPYEILKVLGRGGMGTVFHAVHGETGEEVAVKLLSAHYADDDHFRSRFASEVETLLKLRHPNIVRLVSYGQEEGQLFFAMELVDGQSFHEVLKSGHRFTWQEVIEYTRQICAGLRHAHDRGIIHRDLKPGNLLLTADGITKITDFGIAKQFGGRQITAVGGVVGTVDFMSPEQVRGKSATIRSDMYSLGAVMYTLLARRPPFTFASVSEATSVLEKENAARVTVFAPECPGDLANIIHKLLEKEPQKRIGTPQALAKRLDHLADELAARGSRGGDEEEDHESFDIMQGPVAAHEKYPVSGEVFNQPTAPAEIPDDQTSYRAPDDEDDEIRIAEPEPTNPSRSPATVENTDFTLSPQSRADYFATVNPEEKHSPFDDDHLPIWFYAVSLVLLVSVIGIGVYAVVFWRPSADQLFARIERLMQESDDPTEAAQPIREFQRRFPQDERISQVRWYELRLEADRLPRRLQLKSRIRGVHDLLPIEQDFLRAMELADYDPVKAREQFQAIAELYRDFRLSKSQQQCIIAARTQIEVLDRIIAENQSKRREQVDQALQMANEQLASNPERAREICRSIVALYADRDWAEDLVEEAQQLLKLMEAPVTSPPPSEPLEGAEEGHTFQSMPYALKPFLSARVDHRPRQPTFKNNLPGSPGLTRQRLDVFG